MTGSGERVQGEMIESMDQAVDHPLFRVRDVEPSDGPAIATLLAASPDTGLIRLRLG